MPETRVTEVPCTFALRYRPVVRKLVADARCPEIHLSLF